MNGPDFQYDGLTAFAPITSVATAKKKGLLSAADYTLLHSLGAQVLATYTATTDLISGGTLAAGIWNTINVPSLSFTPTRSGGVILVLLSGAVVTGSAQTGVRFLLDGTTPLPVGGGIAGTGLGSGGPVVLEGLSLAAHTLQFQMIAVSTVNVYCRPATYPDYESLKITVLELGPGDGTTAGAGSGEASTFTIRGAGDYDNTSAPTDGQAVAWNATTGKFHPATVSATATTASGNVVLDPTTTDGDLLYRHAHAGLTTVAVGFIGDSITAGYLQTTPLPTVTATDLTGHGITVTAYNQGHNGAKAADWRPGASSGYLSAAYTAFAAAGVRIVHVMLGMNNAAQNDISTYRADMLALLNDLVAHGYIAVLTDSTASTDSSINSQLVTLAAENAALINGVTVLRGDTQGYGYLLANPSQITSDGLHPTDAAVPSLAQYWADVLHAPVMALTQQLALDRIPIGAAGEYLRVNGAGTGYEFGTPSGTATETYGVVFNNAGDVSLKNDGTIATKRL